MAAYPTVTAVVLNYDGRDLLEIILPSLAAQTYEPLEMIVVDNGSRDGSRTWLAEHWPAVEVVPIAHNVGVAAALNRGVTAARGSYVALLNNDLELDPRWVSELVEVLNTHPDVATVACKLRSYGSREHLDGTGDVLTRAMTARRRGGGELDLGQYDEDHDVFAPTAGAALYRASALAAVGPFDESFFAYYEDVDWGLRARLMGLRCRYVPAAVGYHMGAATTGGNLDAFYWALNRRNLVAVIVKNLPLRLLARHIVPIATAQAALVANSVKRGMLLAQIKVFGAVIAGLPGWLKDRRRIQRGRRISVDELDAMLLPAERRGTRSVLRQLLSR